MSGMMNFRTIDDLLNRPIAEEIERTIALLRKLQETMYTLASKNEDGGLTVLKIGTVLTFAVLKKISGGRMPAKFTAEDWEDIAESVADYAVLRDGREYTVFVFGLYADYIRWSASLYKGRMDPQKVRAIASLADELGEKTSDLKKERISEPQYVEDCLWICLEAMVKLLSSLVYLHGSAELGDAVQAAAMLSYEYGRLMLYSKEQAILAEYEEKQHQLDEELEARFESFMQELEADSDEFKLLISRAFAPGFRDSLMASAELAHAAGVKDEEILKSMDEIDEFFL